MSYVRFYSDAIFTLGTNGNTKLWNGTASNAMEYSTNGSSWSSWDGTSPITAGLISTMYYLFLRGTGNTKISNSTSNSASTKFILTGTQVIESDGNIESLLDYSSVDNYQHPTLGTYAFAYLFYNQTLLHTAPNLGSTPNLDNITVTERCCYGMFKNCIALEQPPVLAVSTLASYCFGEMFYGCTSLISAPYLNATTLANYCYESMFCKCTSLTLPPELPATNLAEGCYSSMFWECSHLTAAPELPATTLANYCYDCMFYGCTSLEECPELPATTLANYCYDSMFGWCTSIKRAPELPATTLTEGCYLGIFYYCEALEIPSELPATTLAYCCYRAMYSGCSSLKYAPELPATVMTEEGYYAMFDSCTSLTIPPALPATTLAPNCYAYMFNGCTSLETLPELPATTFPASPSWPRGIYIGMFTNSGVQLSATQTSEYQYTFRMPATGTGDTQTFTDMFSGTITAPSSNTTYYVKNKPIKLIEYQSTVNELTSIANAIREKTGGKELLNYPYDYIQNILTLGGNYYVGHNIPADNLGVDGDIYIMLED